MWTLCTAFRSWKTSAWFSSMDQSYLKYDWMRNVYYKAIRCLLSLTLGLHSVFTYFSCHLLPEDKLVNAESFFHGLVNTWMSRSTSFTTALMCYYFNACWSQLLMGIGLRWSKRQILMKKLPAHTTSGVIQHPSMSRGKSIALTRCNLLPSCNLWCSECSCQLYIFVQNDYGPPSERKICLCSRLQKIPAFWHTDASHSGMGWSSACSFGDHSQMLLVSPLRCMTGTTPSYQSTTHRWGSAWGRTAPSTKTTTSLSMNVSLSFPYIDMELLSKLAELTAFHYSLQLFFVQFKFQLLATWKPLFSAIVVLTVFNYFTANVDYSQHLELQISSGLWHHWFWRNQIFDYSNLCRCYEEVLTTRPR